MPNVSVVIPTLNAAYEIEELLSIIESQSIQPMEVLIVDSESDDDTVLLAKNFGLVKTMTIRREEFNHGTTRHTAFLNCLGEYVCFLTQDAIPINDRYLENLIAPMRTDPQVALVSGRQIPKKDARRFEQLVREYNYPDRTIVRSREDLPVYGIKTFFASDVCSVYRRDAYLSCGGFDRVGTNEDMLMAAKLIAAGHKVVYEPTAAVFHSHNLSLYQQFNRNKVVGEFLEEHAADLMSASEIGEGSRLVKYVASSLLSEKQVGELFAFGLDCAARLAGNRVGRLMARRSLRKVQQ